MEVTANQVTSTKRAYHFDTPLSGQDMSWLNESRFIERYEVSDKTITVYGTHQTDWEVLERDFIIPGLKKTFGPTLKINEYAASR